MDARKGGPESKDEMLAHALLRAEPDPLDLEFGPAPRAPTALDPIDDFGDVDRTTLPPPEAMNLHVARMMAQAELLEDLDSDGDRPTPLIAEDSFLMARQAPAARDSRPSAGREARPSRPRAGAVVRFDSDRKDTPLMQLDSGELGAVRAPQAVEIRATPIARIDPERRGTPERKPTPEPLSLSRVPPSQEGPDLSDLPAVFALDAFGMDEPSSEAAISPTLAASPPSSAPAISQPFGSLESLDLAAELAEEVPVGPSGPSAEVMSAIDARFSAGDYGRALVLAESALNAHPGDPEIVQYAESCREMLYRRYLERLGAGDHIPRLAMQRSALTGLTLDHRAGFLLSCVDGGSTLEEIIDVSAMPRLEAVRLLYELVQEGVIEMAAPR